MPKIEILEHPVNETIRRKNKMRLDQGKPAKPLITEQMSVCRNGLLVGWLNFPRNPAKQPGVAMILTVDDETRDAIQKTVEAYLKKPVKIGKAAVVVDDDHTEADDE